MTHPFPLFSKQSSTGTSSGKSSLIQRVLSPCRTHLRSGGSLLEAISDGFLTSQSRDSIPLLPKTICRPTSDTFKYACLDYAATIRRGMRRPGMLGEYYGYKLRLSRTSLIHL